LHDKEVHGLQTLIEMELRQLLMGIDEEPGPEIRKIRDELFDDPSGDHVRGFDDMKESLQELFRAQGLEVDLSDLHAGMSEDELNARMQEVHRKLNEPFNARPHPGKSRKPTKKQLAEAEMREKMEVAKKKTIQSIYKGLAKMFHPDLEPDEQLKRGKEELMKQLTVAYENRDMVTLLRLELEWIAKEENDPAKLADEKLAVYNEVLKEQIAQLEMEGIQIQAHPRYDPLIRISGSPFGITHINMKGLQRELTQDINTINKMVSRLEGKNAVVTVKEMIKEFQDEYEPLDDVAFWMS
jgi:hypothetical protein